MQTLLLVAELIIAVALIGFVLLQRSEGGALAWAAAPRWAAYSRHAAQPTR